MSEQILICYDGSEEAGAMHARRAGFDAEARATVASTTWRVADEATHARRPVLIVPPVTA